MERPATTRYSKADYTTLSDKIAVTLLSWYCIPPLPPPFPSLGARSTLVPKPRGKREMRSVCSILLQRWMRQCTQLVPAHRWCATTM